MSIMLGPSRVSGCPQQNRTLNKRPKAGRPLTTSATAAQQGVNAATARPHIIKPDQSASIMLLHGTCDHGLPKRLWMISCEAEPRQLH